MTIEQIRKAYQDKEHVPCPITERLVKAGYQQEKDGYIGYAHDVGMEIKNLCFESIVKKVETLNIVRDE